MESSFVLCQSGQQGSMTIVPRDDTRDHMNITTETECTGAGHSWEAYTCADVQDFWQSISMDAFTCPTVLQIPALQHCCINSGCDNSICRESLFWYQLPPWRLGA
jgi:hypothetical protein